jgi:hypothetical protein
MVLVGGAGAAIGATQLSPREERQAVVEDAAKQLGVTPKQLEDALRKALENRVDAAVASGRITEEQAQRLKERIRAGELPLFGLHGPRGRDFRGGPVGAAHGVKLKAAATYLGVTKAQLRESLRARKTLAQVATERGKPVAGLVDALVAAHVQRLDAAVAAGRLTKVRRDALAARVKERVTAMVNGERPLRGPGFRGHDHGRGMHGFDFGGPGDGDRKGDGARFVPRPAVDPDELPPAA